MENSKAKGNESSGKSESDMPSVTEDSVRFKR